jgi:tRNA pseudouridine38-40 synthase
MPRYFFEISYNGTPFYGWQKQIGQLSVQEVIEKDIQKLFQKEKIEIVGCGRTDKGVHAKQYYFHVDLKSEIDNEKLVFKLNRMLPESVSVHSIYEVPGDLHARFSAKKRTYRYFIHQQKNPFLSQLSTYLPGHLNVEEMQKGCSFLLGTQDFSSFAKIHTDVKTHICTVHNARWFYEGEQLIFEITADRFLRNMVRAIVGTLVDIGMGKLTLEDLPKIIVQKNRSAASKSIGAEGLYLWKVEYE